MTDLHVNRAELTDLLTTLLELRQAVCSEGGAIFEGWQSQIERRAFVLGALNLARYLALRQRDLRPLQPRLQRWGLSSLGRSEARVLPNLDTVIAMLAALAEANIADVPPFPTERAVFRGERMLNHNTQAIFGAAPTNRQVRIMVTMPTAAADDYALVRDLLARGMNVIRINCAHDTPDDWELMIANLRRAEAETGRSARVHMDLGGPKPRTGVVLSGRPIRVYRDDQILFTRHAPKTTQGYKLAFNCTLPEIFDQLRVGGNLWIDDGKIGTRIAAIEDDRMILQVTHARIKGEKIRVDKGLNFPDIDLQLDSLTAEDLDHLAFVAEHADLIGYSFVQDAGDVEQLQDELRYLSDHPTRQAIIAKIETNRAVRNLPEIIVQGAGKQPLGVMIARGDLAVELGYQRMAEIQEELLWLCEAAHIPVIWATQVLEGFAKSGTPSRAEMTDAAMGVRAECVMLNKGPYIAETVTALDDVLGRMTAHQLKKTPQLRALRSWADFIRAGDASSSHGVSPGD